MEGGVERFFVCTFISTDQLVQTYDQDTINRYSRVIQVCSSFITMIIKCQLK